MNINVYTDFELFEVKVPLIFLGAGVSRPAGMDVMVPVFRL